MKNKTIPDSCVNKVKEFQEITVKSDEINYYNWGIPSNYDKIISLLDSEKSSYEDYLLKLKEFQRDIQKQLNIVSRIFDHYECNYNLVNNKEKELNLIYDSCKIAMKKINLLIESTEKRIINKDNYSKYPLLLEVLDIKTFLNDLSSSEEKLSFLNFLEDEVTDISSHFTDDEIDAVLLRNELQDKYKRRNYFGDFGFVEYRYDYLKQHLSYYVLPYIKKEFMKYNGNQNSSNSNTENVESLKNDDKSDKVVSDIIKLNPIRLHWQSDNILIPYLLERLFEENFINYSDYELRRDFIEQSFYKKSGGIFSAKEAGSAESNYKLNTESKPKNSHKVDRVIDDIKSKRDELTKKKVSRSMKK